MARHSLALTSAASGSRPLALRRAQGCTHAFVTSFAFQSPASTSVDTLDVLILGYGPAVVQTVDGTIHQVRDDRLAQLPGRERFDEGVPADEADEPRLWRDLVAFQKKARNRPGGY
jgi:hypothetical protein